jgi:hypothetical protein
MGGRMLKNKKCPECGGDIIIQYVVPTKSYRIENGKFVRDDAWVGGSFDEPEIRFVCSNDIEHEYDEYDPWTWTDNWITKAKNQFIKEVLNNE